MMQLLRTIAHAGVRNPDVYIISPFRIVAHEIRNLLRSEAELLAAFGVQERRFLEERVGTIHTFQGKEAEAVIAVLGAPLETQRGARQWAASTPNILNVVSGGVDPHKSGGNKWRRILASTPSGCGSETGAVRAPG